MYALWSSTFALGKMAVESCPPVCLTALRMLFAGVLITGFLVLFKRKSLIMNKKQWISIGLLGLFSIYLTNICEFWGLKYLTSAKACFLYSLTPFFAAIFSYIHFKEKITLKKVLGLSIGFVGFIPVLMTGSGAESLLHAFSFFSWPDLALMGAALFSTYGWVLLRVVVKDGEISPISANGLSMLIGGALALIHSLFIDSWTPLPIASGKLAPVALSIGMMTLVSNIICYNLYGFMLRRFTATFLSFVGLFSPIFASITGRALLGEALNPLIFLSSGIITLGMWLVYQEELRQGYINKTST